MHQRLSTEERRQQLFEFAAAEIDIQRHLPVGYDRIAVRAGVTPPLIYSYFSEDEEIYIGIVDLHLTRLDDALLDGGDTIDQAIEIYFNFISEHGSALPIILSDPYMQGKLPTPLRLRLSALILRIARLIMQQSTASKRDVLLALLTYLAIPEDLVRQCQEGELDQAAALQVAQELADRALAGLGHALRRGDHRSTGSSDKTKAALAH